MEQLSIELPKDKKIYFASDFHLGAPSESASRAREKRIIRWIESVESEVSALFLVGDIFDFWFEYPHVVPKGFVRFLGKLAALCDRGIPVYFFHGNHDMWMFDYLEKEIGIKIYKDLVTLSSANQKILIGHGDGLGPGDYTYKFLKSVFRNPLLQWLFKWLHPTVGFSIATGWSSHSRINNDNKEDLNKNENEWLYQYCKNIEQQNHHDYYVFGHRHLPLEISINNDATYINLGEWVNFNSFASFDGQKITLEKFEE
jgi:UDP-2,3-diacylglucosamine hydrolase